MKVLDASFLIDLLEGDADAVNYMNTHDSPSQTWIVPSSQLAEVLVGYGNLGKNVYEARNRLNWHNMEVEEVDESTALLAGQIAKQIGPQGPHVGGIDAIAAAVGHQRKAPVVAGDGDLTHPETQNVVDVETY